MSGACGAVNESVTITTIVITNIPAVSSEMLALMSPMLGVMGIVAFRTGRRS